MRWIVSSLIVVNIAVFVWFAILGGNDAVTDAQGSRGASSSSGVPSISLLAEVNEPAGVGQSSSGQESGGDKPFSGLPSVDEDGNALCTLVGPFPKLLRAEYFIERLAALDVSSSIYNLEIPGDVAYWVFLPPEESRKQADTKLRELRARGIDSYVIPKGELENGISFGMFNQSKLADATLKGMNAQGYAAELKEIARSYKEIWVLIQPEQASLIGEKAWLKALSEDDGLERRQNYCPAVASK